MSRESVPFAGSGSGLLLTLCSNWCVMYEDLQVRHLHGDDSYLKYMCTCVYLKYNVEEVHIVM